MMIIFLCVAAYFTGAVPTGYLITRLVKGVDIRSIGSGNPGATNVYRTAGAAAGVVTFVLDVLKGFLPVIFTVIYSGSTNSFWWILVGLCTVSGHIWTVFLGFRGGKGVATACGVFFALMPLPTFYAFALFLAVVFLTRYVSAGSIAAALFLPVFAWFTNQPKTLFIFTIVIGILIIIKHGKNIERLINGSENKFGEKINE